MSSVWHLESSSSSVWHLESCLRFGFQSHHPTRHLVLPSSFSFNIRSCHAYSFWHFKSPSFLIFGIQSRFSSTMSFRVTAPDIHVHWHYTSYLHGFAFVLSLSSPHYIVLVAYSSCSSKLPIPLHMTWSLEFTTHISIMLLGTLHLASSCSYIGQTPLDESFPALGGGSTITHLWHRFLSHFWRNLK